MDEILDCPCCGFPARVIEYDDYYSKSWYYVRCEECGMRSEEFRDQNSTIEAWSRRPLLDVENALSHENAKEAYCLGCEETIKLEQCQEFYLGKHENHALCPKCHKLLRLGKAVVEANPEILKTMEEA